MSNQSSEGTRGEGSSAYSRFAGGARGLRAEARSGTLKRAPQMPLTQGECFAQVDSFHLRVASQFPRGAGPKDAAVVDDIGAVGDTEGLAHIMVGDQDADAGLFQAEDDALQL